MLLYAYICHVQDVFFRLTCDIRKDASFAHFSDECLLYVYFPLRVTMVLA